MRSSQQNLWLHAKRPSDTRVLYLAEYAPDHPVYGVKAYQDDGEYPEYHFEIYKTLCDLGYNTLSCSKPYALASAGGNVDFVFSLMNRMPIHNSEIFVSAFCEFLRLPYLGALPNIRALAEDKYLSKLAFRALGIPVPEGRVYRRTDSLSPPAFPGPYFVKDRFGAGSEGISCENLQDDWQGAVTVVQQLHNKGKDALVEEFCPGIDVTVPVVGQAPYSILGHVIPRSDKPQNILTEDLKLDDHLGYELVDIGPMANDIAEDIDKIWQTTGPMDYFRADYRIDLTTGARRFLEFNLCCYLGSDGAIALAAHEHGLSHQELVGHIVEYSLQRQIGTRQHCQWIL